MSAPFLLPYNSLPLWGRVAIERLDADPTLRVAGRLDLLLERYAECYRETVSPEIRLSAHRICCRRFRETFQADHCAECGEVWPCSDTGRTDISPLISTSHMRKFK